MIDVIDLRDEQVALTPWMSRETEDVGVLVDPILTEIDFILRGLIGLRKTLNGPLDS